jgi:hypothetical protein
MRHFVGTCIFFSRLDDFCSKNKRRPRVASVSEAQARADPALLIMINQDLLKGKSFIFGITRVRLNTHHLQQNSSGLVTLIQNKDLLRQLHFKY